jgi:hypothetical protein
VPTTTLGPAPAEPAQPTWSRALDWLHDIVGHTDLDALTADPLPACDLPGDVPEGARAMLGQLDERIFIPELRNACDAALAELWGSTPRLVESTDPAELAAAICWLVGRANGVVGAGQGITQTALAEAVGQPRFPTALVGRVKRELVGVWPVVDRPWGFACPDLLVLRHPELLTSATRRHVIRVRDEARLRSRAERADVLPSEVES